MTTRPFPQLPIEDLWDLVDAVRALDLRTVTHQTVIELLGNLTRGWTVQAPRFDAGLHLFRGTARFPSRPPRFVSDFSYPPPDKCPLGRANREGSPLLYCAAARSIVPFELHVEPGQELAVIHYETTDDLTVNSVGYTRATFERLKSARVVPNYMRMDATKYSEGDLLLQDFFSEAFCETVPRREEWRYRLTAALAEKLLGTGPQPMRGLMYPTVPMWGNADNLALKPEFADSSLQPIYAEYLLVTQIAETSVGIEVLDEARHFEPDGSIVRLGHQGRWTVPPNSQLKFEAVDEHWVARAADGTVVHPE